MWSSGLEIGNVFFRYFSFYFISFSSQENFEIHCNYFECLCTAYCEPHQIPVIQKNLFPVAFSQDCRFKNAEVMIETFGRTISNWVFVETTSFFVSSWLTRSIFWQYMLPSTISMLSRTSWCMIPCVSHKTSTVIPQHDNIDLFVGFCDPLWHLFWVQLLSLSMGNIDHDYLWVSS